MPTRVNSNTACDGLVYATARVNKNKQQGHKLINLVITKYLTFITKLLLLKNKNILFVAFHINFDKRNILRIVFIIVTRFNPLTSLKIPSNLMF